MDGNYENEIDLKELFMYRTERQRGNHIHVGRETGIYKEKEKKDEYENKKAYGYL